MYTAQAMDIIHWMVNTLKDCDLFANEKTNNPPFVKRSTKEHDYDLKGKRQKQARDTSSELMTVDATILPITCVEKAHLAVYDCGRQDNVIPYRLLTYDINDKAYHRSVYLNIIGRYKDHLEFGNINTELLFQVRKKK